MRRPAHSVVPAAALALVAGLLVALGTAPVPASAEPLDPLFADQIDDYADYDGAHTCSPTDKPGAVELRDLLVSSYPGTTGSISRSCSGTGSSEHHEGRAVDWMVSASTERDKADDLFRWLFADDAYGHRDAMVRRLGIMYIIWDHQIWRAYDADEGWEPYSGENPHTDHVHISMSWDGALERTTWFTDAGLGMRLDQARFAATWRGPHRLDVVRRSADGEVQQRTWSAGWGTWQDLGAETTSGPAAVWARRTLWVFARSDDGTLLQRRWSTRAGWQPWEDTGVEIKAAPGASSKGRRVDVVVVTPTSTAAHRSWKPRRGWEPWTDLGGVVTAPAATVWSSADELEVYVRGSNGRLYQKSKVGGAWSGWVDLGGVLASGPAATSSSPGRSDVFVRTNRASVSHRYDTGAGWSSWYELGGRHVSAPTASALGSGRIDLFTRDRDAGLRQNYYQPGTGWSGWATR